MKNKSEISVQKSTGLKSSKRVKYTGWDRKSNEDIYKDYIWSTSDITLKRKNFRTSLYINELGEIDKGEPL